MAENIVSGLFGLDPYQIQQQRKQQADAAAQAFGNQDPYARANSLTFGAGSAFGNAGAGLMGMQDPQMQQAQMTRAALGGVDLSDPDAILQRASEIQDPKLKLQLGMLARQIQEEKTKMDLQKAHAKYYGTAKTDTSMAQLAPKLAIARARAMEIGRQGGLSGQDLIDFTDAEVEKVRAYFVKSGGASAPSSPEASPYDAGIKLSPGTAIDQSLKITQRDKNMMIAEASARGDTEAVAKIKELPVIALPKSKADVAGEVKKAETLAANDPGALSTGAAAKEGGKTGVEINTKLYHMADAASKVIIKTDALINQLKTGDVTTGLAADLRIGLSRLKSLLGGESGAKNATDSQIADVMMGSEVFPLISSLGIGARGMDTPAEREFLRKVLTGELTLEKGTLLRMAELRKEAAQRDIDTWDRKVDEGSLDTYFSNTGIPKTKFGKPKVTAPTEADINATAAKYKITPAEVKRRLGL